MEKFRLFFDMVIVALLGEGGGMGEHEKNSKHSSAILLNFLTLGMTLLWAVS